MRVLVTGSQGQLAQSLAELADQIEHDIYAVGRPALDLRAPDSIASVFDAVRPEIVVNAAAYTAVDAAEDERDAAFAVNETGAHHVATACSKANIPLLHISTDYVFSGDKSSAYVETDPTGPTGAYGQSKLAGEHAVATACAEHIILRTAWVHSPFGKNFVKTMLRLATSRDEVGVVSDQVGSPTYAPHLAKSIIELLDQIARRPRHEIPWGLYHAAGDDTARWSDVAEQAFAAARRHGLPACTVKPISTADYPTPAKRPQNSCLNCDKLGNTFAIRLPNWRRGVDECVQRLANNTAA